jgi:hypothetical protein
LNIQTMQDSKFGRGSLEGFVQIAIYFYLELSLCNDAF